MGKDRTLKGIGNVDQLLEPRLWKALDSISDRLGDIETQLSEVVRLEERVKNHDQALSRYGNRLDNHDARLRESELWQANYGDKTGIERLITHIQEDVTKVREKVAEIESTGNISKGQKDVGKEVFKWLAGILAAILIFKMTKG